MEYLAACAAYKNRQGETDASLEGTNLHDFMAKMLEQVKAGAYATTIEQLNDWVTANYQLDDNQVSWLRFCCHECDKVLSLKPAEIYVELPISTQDFREGGELNHGFLDVLFIFRNGNGLIIDFKFGWVPVPHAKENLQGKNYVLGAFLKFGKMGACGVKFVQPKLGLVTEACFRVSQVMDLYAELRNLIDQAKFVQANEEAGFQFMGAGAHCEYCVHNSDCAVLAATRGKMAQRLTELPVLPATFPSMTLTKPEDWALARYWVETIEKGLEDFKKRATAAAINNGGSLRCTLPNGEEVLYEMRERSVDRVLGPAADIAEVLKEYVTYEQLMAAADLSLTALLKIAQDAVCQAHEASRAEGEKKLTKKAAKEQVESTLTAHGLLSTPDTKIRYLKLVKNPDVLDQKQEPKQIAPGSGQTETTN